jgi:PAS domain S-box-containing protein
VAGLFWEGKKGSEHIYPEDLGIGNLFEVCRDKVIVADAKTQRIVLWNSAAISTFGYSLAEPHGMRVEDLVPERFKAQHRAGMAHLHEMGKGSYADANRLLDLPTLAKTGKNIRVELSFSPITSKDEGSDS